jgi:hypothetical protein
VVGALAVAWFASAAGVIRQPWGAPYVPARPAAAQQQEPVTFDVHAQAERLRKRLAAAPAPRPRRNPFAFAQPRPVPATRPVAPAAAPTLVAAASTDEELPLELIGMAEDGAGEARVRTAMIAADGDELLLVRVGDSVGRYQVSAISADAVELKDPATDRVRRLVLR